MKQEKWKKLIEEITVTNNIKQIKFYIILLCFRKYQQYENCNEF